jgi:toxin ParE1/3/4
VAHEIRYSPEARDDLRQLYFFIAERSGEERALAYVERIETYCRGFADFPERGVRRDDLLPGLRIVGFERRVAIAFHLDPGTVTFDRVLYGGRDLGALVGDK